MAKKPSHANLIKIYHHHPISHCESLRFTFKLSSILDRCSFSSLMCLLPCHHYLNTTSKSIISSRRFLWKSEHHLMKGRENPPRSEIKLKLFDNQLDSSKNASYVIIYMSYMIYTWQNSCTYDVKTLGRNSICTPSTSLKVNSLPKHGMWDWSWFISTEKLPWTIW